MTKVIIIVIVATIITLVGFAVVDKVNGTIVASSTSTSYSSSDNRLSVTISGEIKKGGTYLVPIDSALSDLIVAAGGATTNADPKAYDGDYVLTTGETFYIAPIYDNSNTCAATPIDKVNINSADKTGLMKVGAIGTTIASAIVSYRDTNGSFRRIEELKNVTGIGNATFEKVKDYVQILD